MDKKRQQTQTTAAFDKVLQHLETGTLPKRKDETPEQHQQKEAAFKAKLGLN